MANFDLVALTELSSCDSLESVINIIAETMFLPSSIKDHLVNWSKQ